VLLLGNSKKRVEWVDIGKYICIMFVIVSHTESGTATLQKFYLPFFLSTFFFLSGYVYNQPPSFKEHLRKKAKGLLVPWFIFSNLNIILSAVVSFRENQSIASEFVWNLLQIRSHGDGVWFVAALFMAYLPFYFFIKWGKPAKACAVAFCLSLCSILYSNLMPKGLLPWGDAALPWHLEYVFQAMLWMVLGYYFRVYAEKKWDALNTVPFRIALWAAYFIVSFTFDYAWGYRLVSYLQSAVGIMAVISLSKSLKSNDYLRFVGANTLTYFALHGKVLALFQKVLQRFSFYAVCLQSEIWSSLLAIAIAFVISVVLIIPAEIINRWFPWMLGRQRKAK